MSKLKLAIIGLGNRGSGLLRDYLVLQEDVEFTHVCDGYPERVEAAADAVRKAGRGNPVATTDYRDALRGDADAVIVATSWETHIEIAIASLRAGKVTAIEVGGAADVRECHELVRAHEETRTPFMFLENCCYNREELLALRLAREGILGEVVHCSGVYTHDLRREVTRGVERNHYRLSHYLTRNCENYPTHELGPIAKILDINRGNRMVSLVSMASKAAGMERYIEKHADKLNPDLRGKKFAQGDVVHTLIQCANGETILLKLDTTLPAHYDRELIVKGVDGSYRQSSHSVVIDGVDNKEEIWNPSESLARLRENAARYHHLLPAVWRDMTEEQKRTGHGGMDGIMLRDFINRAKARSEMPIDVYDAASWMAVTALSAESIRLGSVPVAMPDFTNGQWRARPRMDVM